MAQKRRALGALSEAGQDVAQVLKSPEARQCIETDTEELTQRWDNLVQRLEDCSNQVTQTSTLFSQSESGILLGEAARERAVEGLQDFRRVINITSR